MTTAQTNLASISDYASPSAITTRAGRSVADATRLMRDNHIRHLPVLDAGKIVGIVSERDLLMVSAIKGVRAEDVAVEEAMTPDPYVVHRDTSVLAAATEMWTRKLGSAVVVEGEKVVGVFTTTDALQALVEVLAGKPVRAVAR